MLGISGPVLFANVLLLVAVHDAAPDDPLQILRKVNVLLRELDGVPICGETTIAM